MFFPLFPKKGILLFFFLNTFYFTHSQSFELGVSGSLGAAYLINENFFQSGTNQSYRFTLSDSYGLQGTKNFKGGTCFEFGLFMATLRQGYSGSFGKDGYLPGISMPYYAGESYTSKVQLNIIEFPFIYRHLRKSGAYIELGGAYDIYTSSSYSASYSNPSFSVNRTISNQYPAGNFLLLAGIGKEWRIKGTDFYLLDGVRFTYAMLDLQGVDGHGQNLMGANSVPLYAPNIGAPYYTSYHMTHAIELSFNLGIFYRFYSKDVHKRVIDFN